MKRIIQTCFLALFVIASLQGQLNPDRHTTSPSDGWLSCNETMNPDPANGLSHWIMIDIQSTEQITTFKMWNHNDPASLDNGVDRLKVQYSLDATTWVDGGEYNIARSDGSAFYEGIDVTNFNGASMRYILLTAQSTHGGTCAGIAETRFYLGQAVPVELASFKGNCEDGEKQLQWSFADVSDFASVEVQYSTDGKEWTGIYTTSNMGSETDGIYSNKYSDTRLINESNHFYRLRLNDINGDFKFSDIVEVNCEINENDVRTFPNPVSDKLYVDVELIDAENIDYQLTDILGKIVSQGVFNADAGNNRFNINTTELIEGNYILSLQIGSKNIEKKIIKFKE